MSFLKKLGQVLYNLVGIVTGVGPLIKPFLGSGKASGYVSTAINDFTAIGSTVIQIETALQGKSGADKLAACVPLVKQIIQSSEMVSGHQIANEAEFTAACTDITNGVVRLLNSLKADNIKVQGDTHTVVSAAPATPVPAVSNVVEIPAPTSAPAPVSEPAPVPTTQTHPLALS